MVPQFILDVHRSVGRPKLRWDDNIARFFMHEFGSSDYMKYFRDISDALTFEGKFITFV